MQNFKELIDWCNKEGGKILVINEAGDVQLIITSAKLSQSAEKVLDSELINNAIVQAQLEEEEVVAPEPETSHGPTHIKELFKSIPADRYTGGKGPFPPKFTNPDLRAEVIDPTFNFDVNPEDVLNGKVDVDEI